MSSSSPVKHFGLSAVICSYPQVSAVEAFGLSAVIRSYLFQDKHKLDRGARTCDGERRHPFDAASAVEGNEGRLPLRLNLANPGGK